MLVVMMVSCAVLAQPEAKEKKWRDENGAHLALAGGTCKTTVGGEVIFLPVGQSLEVGGSWRNCEVYDGHPVIVFSAVAPRPAEPRRGRL